MIDFHAHFLQDMDDGSKSIEESLQMLKLSYNMGVDTIVSTPHFFAYHESISTFLNRRNERLCNLTNALEGEDDVPKIVEGAEVAFYSGMCSDKELLWLCIGNTKCLMIEMPFCSWSSLVKRELLSIIFNRGITPIIAHIERYFDYPQNSAVVEELLNHGAIAQINAECLISGTQKKRELKLIRERETVLLGSDCHNMNDRQPNLDKALKVIEKNIGELYLDKIEKFSRGLFA